MTDHTEELHQRIAALEAENERLRAAVDQRIPCDVMLPPATKIKRGCPLSTVLAGMKMREDIPANQQVFSATPAQEVRHDEDAWQTLHSLSKAPQDGEKMTAERLHAICEIGHDRQAFVARLAAQEVRQEASIDERLIQAGMLSVAQLLKGAPLDAFIKHAGVHDLSSLLQWAEMRRGECLRMMARYDLGEKNKGDDLYEWTVAHCAVFTELHVNLRAALATTPQPGPDVGALVEALKAADEYLSDNPFNEIASGSILHRQMKDALAAHRQAQRQA